MTVRIDAGFDIARLGTHRMTVNDGTGSFQILLDASGVQYAASGGGSVVVSSSATEWCHTDISSVMGTGRFAEFAAALQTALRAGSGAHGGSEPITVSYDTATGKYTIGTDLSFTVALTFSTHAAEGTRMRQLLGYSGDRGAAIALLAENRAYYSILAAMPAKSKVERVYNETGMISGAVANGGAHYAIGPRGFTKRYDFELWFEDAAAMYSESATATVPWTYEHLWEHAQGSTPFAVTDSIEDATTVHHFTPPGADFRAGRVQSDWDMWTLRFATYYEGEV